MLICSKFHSLPGYLWQYWKNSAPWKLFGVNVCVCSNETRTNFGYHGLYRLFDKPIGKGMGWRKSNPRCSKIAERISMKLWINVIISWAWPHIMYSVNRCGAVTTWIVLANVWLLMFWPRLHDTTGCQIGFLCQTGWQTRFTTGLTTALNEQPLFVQPVVKPGCTTGLTTGCIQDTAGCQTGFVYGRPM